MFKTRQITKCAVGVMGLGLWTQVFAAVDAGSVAYVPVDPTAVPTLSEWMLGLLALSLAAGAYRGLRARTGGKPLASLLLMGALALAAASGHLGQSSHALPPTFVFDQAGGGVVVVGPPGEWPIQNTSTRPQRISAVTGITFMPAPTVATPRCVVGLIVPAGGTCYVNFI